jgi:ATP-binding cassette subfamily B multidrug efflux pump
MAGNRQPAIAAPLLLGRGGPPVPGKIERARNVREAVGRVSGYPRRPRTGLTVTVVLVAASTGLNLLGPYLLGRAIDRYILAHDLPGLARIGGLMLATYALAALLTYLQSYVMAGAAQRTIRDLRADLFASPRCSGFLSAPSTSGRTGS